jgi:hypothetical protein
MDRKIKTNKCNFERKIDPKVLVDKLGAFIDLSKKAIDKLNKIKVQVEIREKDVENIINAYAKCNASCCHAFGDNCPNDKAVTELREQDKWKEADLICFSCKRNEIVERRCTSPLSSKKK